MNEIGELEKEYESRRIEWNEFCDHLRAECAKKLNLPERESSKLTLQALVKMAKRVEDAEEGRR